MWDAIRSILVQILSMLTAFWAGKQHAELGQVKNEIKIKEDQVAIATRPRRSSDALLERMCAEAGVPTTAISDTECADNRGIEDVGGS